MSVDSIRRSSGSVPSSFDYGSSFRMDPEVSGQSGAAQPTPALRLFQTDGFDARPVRLAEARYSNVMSDATRVSAAGGTGGTPAIDVDRALRQLNGAAGAESQGLCATFVRRALRAGGMDTSNNPVNARDYGPFLERGGFRRVDATNYTPQRGDVVVLQPPNGEGAGHVAMYNGRQWVSDFRQRDIWAGPSFRNQVPYQVYRP